MMKKLYFYSSRSSQGQWRWKTRGGAADVCGVCDAGWAVQLLSRTGSCELARFGLIILLGTDVARVDTSLYIVQTEAGVSSGGVWSAGVATVKTNSPQQSVYLNHHIELLTLDHLPEPDQ